MILVDPLTAYPGKGQWCHMISDTGIEELHAFAKRVGLSRSWFQNEPRHPHYDLRASKREAAVKLGAREVSHHGLVKALWALYGAPGRVKV